MSASDKKKLRKEQNAAALTEKQLQAKKEAKKLKIYTISFVVAMLLVVAIVVGVIAAPFVSGVISRGTHAVNIGNRQLSTAQLSYYYYDAISSFYSNIQNQYGEYADLYAQMLGGVISTIPLDEQIYDKEKNLTWADRFIDEAKQSAIWTLTMYDAAVAAGFELSEDGQKFLDNFEENMTMYAQMYGYSSLKGYLRAFYGDGADLATYKEYYTYNSVASEYAADYIDSLEFNNEDYREHEKDKYHEYNSYTYISYYVNSSNYLTFLKLGTETKDEEGKTSTTYSDEDKAKALAAAKKDAESLAVNSNNTLEKLNAAIGALDINKDKQADKKPTATETKNALYSSLGANEEIQKWLSASERKEGDITMVANKTKDANDKEVINGYYVVIMKSVNTNERKLANVRHILIKFTGGTKDQATGETVYSDAEKTKAKEKAQAILDQYNATSKKDEDFAKLAKEKSDDTGTKANGGLIENIYRDSGYVESFTDWALADERKPGDTGLVESSYGYHVMYYKEDGDLSYRDFMIDNVLTNEAYEAWENALIEKVTAEDVNLSGMETDYVIAG